MANTKAAFKDIDAGIGEVRLALPMGNLQNYLAPHVPELAGGPAGSMCASQFNTGTSNPTYLLWNEAEPSSRFVLRRKPSQIFIVGAHQIDREYRVQKALENTNVPVAKMYHYCR
jgi:aminoglycoside phosphotransferase (APT) family kinase protein